MMSRSITKKNRCFPGEGFFRAAWRIKLAFGRDKGMPGDEDGLMRRRLKAERPVAPGFKKVEAGQGGPTLPHSGQSNTISLMFLADMR